MLRAAVFYAVRRSRRRDTKILIVDDDHSLALVSRFMLEAEGHEVRTANDGNEGYSTYLFFRPDLVITDLRMPQTDGPEMMRHIRTHDAEIRTVYMTADLGRYGRVLEEERKKYGVAILKKPFSKVELRDCLEPNPFHGESSERQRTFHGKSSQ